MKHILIFAVVLLLGCTQAAPKKPTLSKAEVQKLQDDAFKAGWYEGVEERHVPDSELREAFVIDSLIFNTGGKLPRKAPYKTL